MFPHHDVSDRATPRSAVRAASSRRVGKHRLARRTPLRSVKLVGLTAALAAAAGTSAVTLGQNSGDAAAGSGPSATAGQLDAITSARIERRELASRDMSRFELTLASTRKLQADASKQAQARAVRLAANQSLTERRALALSAAKAAADARKAKAARAAKAAMAAQFAADAAAKKAEAEAAEETTADSGEQRVSDSAAALPLSGYRLTARFGQGGGRWARDHTGLDFAAGIGTPISAVLAGEVIAADYAGSYGRQVKVRHADGTVTSYSHMSEFSVSVGDTVEGGGELGAVGVTGNTTGPHLHFEVLPGGGDPVDPESWLSDQGLNP